MLFSSQPHDICVTFEIEHVFSVYILDVLMDQILFMLFVVANELLPKLLYKTSFALLLIDCSIILFYIYIFFLF